MNCSNGKIVEGEVFFVTPEPMNTLVTNLKAEQNTRYWILKFISFILFWIGLNLIIGPLLAILDVADDFLPFLKFATRGVSSLLLFITAVIAFIVVLVMTLLIKLFWLLIVLSIIGVGVFVYIAISKTKG